MKFHPIKYKQPVFGDSRCALYALANLLDDRAFLLYVDVGQSTFHNSETAILTAYHQERANAGWNGTIRNGQEWRPDKLGSVAGIYPFAIVPSSMRLQYQDFEAIKPESGKYLLALIDHLPPNQEQSHTIGVLWGSDNGCIAIDAQRDAVHVFAHQYGLFELLHVVAVRFLYRSVEDGEADFPQFSPEQLPHIFDLNDCESEFCKTETANMKTELEMQNLRP